MHLHKLIYDKEETFVPPCTVYLQKYKVYHSELLGLRTLSIDRNSNRKHSSLNTIQHRHQQKK
jgi:hypothetical protein